MDEEILFKLLFTINKCLSPINLYIWSNVTFFSHFNQEFTEKKSHRGTLFYDNEKLKWAGNDQNPVKTQKRTDFEATKETCLTKGEKTLSNYK